MNLITSVAKWAKKKGLLDLYPELEDRMPVLRANSEDEQASTGAGQTGFNQAADFYSNHIWLQKAIGKLADNIAPLPLRIARGSGQDTEYLGAHPLLPVLENPNPEMGTADLSRQWLVDMMLGGETGLEVVWSTSRRAIAELWPRQPHTISIQVESKRYRRISGYKIDDGCGDPYLLAADEMVFFKFYNPLQPFRGLSPVGAIRMSIVIDQLAQAWSRLFFRNQARPDFALMAPEGVTATEKRELMEQLTTDFSTGSGVHKPIILENGVTDIKTFSFPAKDTEWLNQRQFSRDEVAAIVGVPDEIMGYGKDTYENFNAAERVLWTLTIMPLAQMRDGTLTRFFRRVNLLKPNEQIVTDLRNVPALQEDKTRKINNARVLFSMGVPLNTASEYLDMGLPTIEGGDVGYLPMGLSSVGLEPEPEPEPDTPPDTELPTEEEPEKAAQPRIKEYGSIEHAALWKRLQARINKPVAELQRKAKKEFQRQQNEITQKLRDSKIYGRGRYKDEENVPSPQSLFDLESEVRKFIEAFKNPVIEVVELIGEDELGALGITGVFDITRPEVQAAMAEILGAVAGKTNESTWLNLVDLFEEAERAGEGIVQIQERLSLYFGDRKSDYQTERIARTTMTGASNAGSVEAWRQSEVVSGKTWISALQPDRTRESHSEAHGQTVGLNEAFTVDGESLMYPGDPQGNPDNIINCLCGTIAVVED